MAIIRCIIPSVYLAYETQVTILLPDAAAGASDQKLDHCKVLYLLHGRGDDSSSWLVNSQIRLFAEEYRTVVIMPAAEDSFYLDGAAGKRYFSYMTKELPVKIQQMFRISSENADTWIAGISMGGYGALRIGLAYPERFAGIGILSAAIRPDQMPAFPLSALEKDILADNLRRTVGSGTLRDEDNPYWLLEQGERRKRRIPHICQYEGTEDFLYACNQDFRNYLKDRKADASYEEWSGGHDWYFWNTAVRKLLMYINKTEKAGQNGGT